MTPDSARRRLSAHAHRHGPFARTPHQLVCRAELRPPNAPLPALRTAGVTHRETQLAKCPATYAG